MDAFEAERLRVDKFRFFIRDEKARQRSSVWFAHSWRNDVYVSVGTLGGHMKLSLHRDGNCQFGIVREYARKLEAAGFVPMPPKRWVRPATPETGTFHAASVLFPTDFLWGSGQASNPGKKKFSFPMAPSGHATEIGIFYSLEPPHDLEAKFIAVGGTPVLYMTLPSGEYVSFVARVAPFDPKQIPNLEAFGQRARPLAGAPAPGTRVDNASAILTRDHPDERRAFAMIEINGLSGARALSDSSERPG